MKLQDIDFRVWDISKKRFYNDLELSILPSSDFNNTFDINLAIIIARNLKSASMFISNYEVDLYTGFRDINDTKIYEGDIVRYYRDSEYKPFIDYHIVFLNYKIEFKAINKEEAGFIAEAKPEAILKSSEVIGNIHENSKLLKGVK